MEKEIAKKQVTVDHHTIEIERLKELRKNKSNAFTTTAFFESYHFLNLVGEKNHCIEIFKDQGAHHQLLENVLHQNYCSTLFNTS